jgi:tRNA pseudouridine synthase 10
MGRASAMTANVAERAKEYEFRTFSVGLSMPEGVQEREDEVRSSMKLKGRETIKTQLSKTIAAGVERLLKKRPDKLNPDLTAVVDVAGSQAKIHSRSLFFYGRYTKPRGVSQRKERCAKCSGSGCETCRMTGFTRLVSVESLVGSRLASDAGAESVKFTWLGSEDPDSKVSQPGRPFVAELKNPRRRKIPRGFLAKTRRGLVRVSLGRLLQSRPTRLPRFRFRTSITAKAARRIAPPELKELSRVFRNAEVVFERPNERPVSKRVYSAVAKARGKDLSIDAELDGGLPVKRFVSGELVAPSVSQVLKTEVRCRSFDIRGVKETGKFEFGEVSRLQAKN